MKLLHISDWHVGLSTGPHARRVDHEKVFAEIAEAAHFYKPDLILHTGDVFHVANAPFHELRAHRHAQVFGQVPSGQVAFTWLFLETLQADCFQVTGDRRIDRPRPGRVAG